ncbi:hypothetical protein NTE_01218 [Candidatus Nitrososphaera evergladensis SR1]|uniref:Uncharacterized protein n=1 Tax=Candidatus Nitrososphaera evergladensis SR1 TaxID=1459636 RepID=A0A075MQD7_9ARCH|nr:hypothetical protein [Candidatus Nitrososphaera evergladensis]AIF83290.1 hypothetical protein NTE_01218 [Candidatus Nitrososphaera evergladensis SR1]
MIQNIIKKKDPKYVTVYVNKNLTGTIESKIQQLAELGILPPNTTKAKFIKHAVGFYLANFSEGNIAGLQAYQTSHKEHGIGKNAKDLYAEIKLETFRAVQTKLAHEIEWIKKQNTMAPSISKLLNSGDTK